MKLQGVFVERQRPTRSETDVAMSSMMMRSSVVPGSMIEAKYSVMFGEQHLARTDTSCKV